MRGVEGVEQLLGQDNQGGNMPRAAIDIPIEIFRQKYHYDPETGKIHHIGSNGRVMRSIKSRKHGTGYIRVRYDGKEYLGHRVAWALHYGEQPPPIIDHINHVTDDNRIANLRGVTHQQNTKNASLSATNKSGHVGVTNYLGARYKARIKHNDRSIHLGVFDTLPEAVAARKAAERKYGFHQNHGTQAPSD